MIVADVKISLLQAAENADRAVLADCVAEVLERMLKLSVPTASFRFEALEPTPENYFAEIMIQLFPSGSAKVRRSVCSQIEELASSRLQLSKERITVQITAPPQERISL